MKAINKSSLMKRAWKIYKSMTNFDRKLFKVINSFAECLKKAWMLEKRDAEADRNRELGITIQSAPVPYYSGAEAYYQSGRRYYGD